MKTYIKTPSLAIAEIGKGGSSAIGQAVLHTFLPEKVPVWGGADPMNTPSSWGRDRVTRTETPDGIVLVPVREPVERFRSACAQTRITDVDDLLTKIENQAHLGTSYVIERGITWDKHFHFRPTVDYTVDLTVKLYKFPEQIDELAAEAGLPVPLPTVNDSNSNNPPKPDLTASQLARVEAIYADDIALYNSITTAGQEFVGAVTPPTPATEEDKALKRSEINTSQKLAEYAGIEVGGMAVRTDKDTQRTLADARSFAKDDPDFYMDWKLGDGAFVRLTSNTVVALASAVLSHVQATRTKESELNTLISEATTLEELNRIIW